MKVNISKFVSSEEGVTTFPLAQKSGGEACVSSSSCDLNAHLMNFNENVAFFRALFDLNKIFGNMYCIIAQGVTE